ncbi:MAG: DUF4352 domain-containing protein [bacterium]
MVRRNILIILVAIISILFIFTVPSCKKKEAKTEETTETPPTTTEIKPPETEGYITVDDRQTIGNYVVLVKGYEKVDEVEGIKAKEGNKLVKVDLEVAYHQNKMWFISANLAFKLVLPDGTKLDTMKYTGKDAFTEGGIKPGEKAFGVVLFEVPKDAKDLSLSCDFTVQKEGKAVIPLKAKISPPA